MSRRSQKLVFVLALAAIAALAFVSTAELLHHHHDNISERVCPLCHPPVIGLQPAALKLPSLTNLCWAIANSYVISVHSPFLLRASSRAPPTA